MRALIRLRGDLVSLRGDLVSLRGDLVSLRGDLVSLRGDLVSLRGDLVSLRGDLVSLRGDLVSLRGDLVSFDFCYERRAIRTPTMFGHLQRAITSGSHKLLPLNESLDSIRSDTSFVFAHFVPWRHYTRSKIKVGRR